MISASTSPTSRLSASPPCMCARSTVLRWTSALPMPSLGTLTASSWTITATANMPNALGGIRRASTIIETTSSSSVAIRARVIHRSPSAVTCVSSSLERASVTRTRRGRRTGSRTTNARAAARVLRRPRRVHGPGPLVSRGTGPRNARPAALRRRPGDQRARGLRCRRSQRRDAEPVPAGLKPSDLRTAAAETNVMVDQPASEPSITRKVALPRTRRR